MPLFFIGDSMNIVEKLIRDAEEVLREGKDEMLYYAYIKVIENYIDDNSKFRMEMIKRWDNEHMG